MRTASQTEAMGDWSEPLWASAVISYQFEEDESSYSRGVLEALYLEEFSVSRDVDSDQSCG